MNNKYSKLLTIILSVAIAIVIILFGFFGYEIYNKYYTKKQTDDMLDTFDDSISNKVINDESTKPQNNSTNTVTNTATTNEVVTPILPEQNKNVINNGGTNNNKPSSGVEYKGYTMVGKIEIPKTKLKCPILGKTSKNSIEVAVAVLYGPGPNQVGNTVIVGHNYKNGTFFSDNKKLDIGDTIYITDTNNKKVKYTIYDKQLLAPEDFDYATRDTKGKREISLSTCTDDVNSRLVIFARE